MSLLSRLKLLSSEKMDQIRSEADAEMKSLSGRFDVPNGPDVPEDLRDEVGRFIETENGYRVFDRMIFEDVLFGSENSAGILSVMFLAFTALTAAVIWAGLSWINFSDPDAGYELGGLFAVAYGLFYFITAAKMEWEEIKVGERFSIKTSVLGFLVVLMIGLAYGLDAMWGGSGWLPLFAFFPVALLPWVTSMNLTFKRNKLLKTNAEKHMHSTYATKHVEARRAQAENAKKDTSPFIQIGVSEGVFSGASLDGFSPDPDVPFGLTARDLSKHLAIFGKTGSGKTHGKLKPIAQQWLGFNCGGALFLDGKGTLAAEIKALFKGTSLSTEFALIEPGLCDFALLEAMSPEVFSNTMADIGVGDPNNDKDKFFTSSGRKWLLSAAYLLKAAYDIEMADCDETAIASGYPNWFALEDDYKEKGLKLPRHRQFHWSYERAVEMATQKMTDRVFMMGDKATNSPGLTDWIAENHPEGRKAGMLRDAIEYVSIEIPKMDERTLGNIESTVRAWLTPIMENKEVRKWASLERGVDITTCLRGGILGVNAPDSKYQKAGTTVTALVKARIFQEIKNRGEEEQWRAKGHLPMMMMVDEAQEVVGTIEKDMVAIGRGFGICMVYATQSIDAYYAKFTEHDTNAMLVNFVSISSYDSTELTERYMMHRIGKPVGPSLSVNPLRWIRVKGRQVLSDPVFDPKHTMNTRIQLRAKLIKEKVMNKPMPELPAKDGEDDKTPDLVSQEVWQTQLKTPHIGIAELQRAGVPRRDVFKSIGVLTKEQLLEMAKKQGIKNPRV